MGHLSLMSIALLAYIVAVSVFLAATGVVLWRVLRGAGRPGSRGWVLAGQELVWTLIPALLLAVLTMAGEVPRPRECAVGNEGVLPGEIASGDSSRASERAGSGAGVRWHVAGSGR